MAGLALVVSLAAMVAGWNYVAAARRMNSYDTARGTVINREVAPLSASLGRAGRWGRGGNYQPKVTYTYVVDGVGYRSDRWSYNSQGLKRTVAEHIVANLLDDVTVYYDPADPQQGYLKTNSPKLGYLLVAAGATVMLVTLGALLA